MLVTDSPASTAKLSAVPSGTGVAMANAGDDVTATIVAATVAASAAVIQEETMRRTARSDFLSFNRNRLSVRGGDFRAVHGFPEALVLSAAHYAQKHPESPEK
ncbi:hypothetical protein [Streptomyces rubiginosohelvolus]|uniref:hypothetical protein n=1 Tax=Streptomyces rubiginosohelvolus TaxID=67362 RepID=UPI001E51FD19|nr:MULTISPECIES: hypothetical protein [Streptomyces]WST54807.1 hypothetical protein OG475_19015 [Streptomyces rubiginosohelvolus]